MISATMATPGLLKIIFFLKKEAYEIIISVHGVINEVLSRNSNYSVNVVL